MEKVDVMCREQKKIYTWCASFLLLWMSAGHRLPHSASRVVRRSLFILCGRDCGGTPLASLGFHLDLRILPVLHHSRRPLRDHLRRQPLIIGDRFAESQEDCSIRAPTATLQASFTETRATGYPEYTAPLTLSGRC